MKRKNKILLAGLVSSDEGIIDLINTLRETGNEYEFFFTVNEKDTLQEIAKSLNSKKYFQAIIFGREFIISLGPIISAISLYAGKATKSIGLIKSQDDLDVKKYTPDIHVIEGDWKSIKNILETKN